MKFAQYRQLLNTMESKMTYKMLCCGGNRIKTKTRNMVMFQYGGTVGPSQFPTFSFKHEEDRHMLPRPVVKSRPGNIGHKLMTESTWLKHLCKDIERLTINHLRSIKNQTSDYILKQIEFCKNIVPPCLRICNTFFTQMIMVGSFNSDCGRIPIHVDGDDFITALLSVGGSSKIQGGSTFYVEKDMWKDNKLFKISTKIPFRNGNVQIGCFDNVLHGTNGWNDCMRGVINFSMQKKLLNHFHMYGTKPYCSYVSAGYPSGKFHAIV